MKTRIFYLSLFDPIVQAECDLIEHLSLYFPKLKEKREIILALLPSSTEEKIRKEMIQKVFAKVTIISFSDFLKEYQEGDDVVIEKDLYPAVSSSLPLSRHIFFLSEDTLGTEENSSEFCYRGKTERFETRAGTYLWAQKDVLDVFSREGLYFMDDVKKGISEHRFCHSLSVAKTAYQIAQNNGLDPILCYHAGLLHDMAKDYPAEDAVNLVKTQFSQYAPCPIYALHQFVGASIAKTRYHVPSDVVDMIEFHCTGKAEMTEYMKCLYAADEVEPLRQFPTEEKRNRCLNDLDEGFLFLVKKQVEYFKSKGIDYEEYWLCREKYRYYLKQE